MNNRKHCFPLTITDHTSRFLIGCEALSGTVEDPCYNVFEQAFKEYGLPDGMRSDNGVPFASGNSLWGLTKLSVTMSLLISNLGLSEDLQLCNCYVCYICNICDICDILDICGFNERNNKAEDHK